MHTSVREFVERAVATYDCSGPVLEVGSRDINGGVRDLFGADYLGVDLIEGPGVDRVVGRSFYRDHARRFAVVVCCEVLEHDPRPWYTVGDIALVLRRGGLVFLTARGFGPDQASTEIRTYGPHDYPADYWRFSVEAMRVLFDDAGLAVIEAGPDTDPCAPGVFMVGRKP